MHINKDSNRQQLLGVTIRNYPGPIDSRPRFLVLSSSDSFKTTVVHLLVKLNPYILSRNSRFWLGIQTPPYHVNIARNISEQ